MEDYRALHHARYVERQRKMEEEEELRRRIAEQLRIEEERDELRATEIFTQFTNWINDIYLMLSIVNVSGLVTSILDLLETEYDFLIVCKKQDKLMEMGANMLEAINSNIYAQVNFHDRSEMEISYNMQNNVKKILARCGVIKEGELDVMFDMDTSNDEVMALQLQQQMENSLNVSDAELAHRISNEINNQERNTPRRRRDDRDGNETAPRPRGRPRRRVI